VALLPLAYGQKAAIAARNLAQDSQQMLSSKHSHGQMQTMLGCNQKPAALCPQLQRLGPVPAASHTNKLPHSPHELVDKGQDDLAAAQDNVAR
jgi:hypothetical protein